MLSVFSIRRPSLPAVLMLALLLSAIAGLATADARAATKRAQVRQLFEPIAAFDRAVRSRQAELAPIADGWAAATTPCVQAAYAEIARLEQAGALSEPEAMTNGYIVFGVAILDVGAELSEPLDAELATAERAYRRMPLQDRVLRVGARGKARELAAVRALGDVDTCRFAREWAETGFSLLEIPDVAPGVGPFDHVAGARTRDVARAGKRLRRSGVSKSRVQEFKMFPLIPLGEPAVRDGLLPPE